MPKWQNNDDNPSVHFLKWFIVLAWRYPSLSSWCFEENRNNSYRPSTGKWSPAVKPLHANWIAVVAWIALLDPLVIILRSSAERRSSHAHISCSGPHSCGQAKQLGKNAPCDYDTASQHNYPVDFITQPMGSLQQQALLNEALCAVLD